MRREESYGGRQEIVKSVRNMIDIGDQWETDMPDRKHIGDPEEMDKLYACCACRSLIEVFRKVSAIETCRCPTDLR